MAPPLVIGCIHLCQWFHIGQRLKVRVAYKVDDKLTTGAKIELTTTYVVCIEDQESTLVLTVL